MNGPPPMPIPQPPPLRPRRPLRLIGIVIGSCVLGVLLLASGVYLEENWRGAHAWTDCQRELTAKGETLDWRAFVPPPIPDAQNLAMAPLFVREFGYKVDPKTHVYTFDRLANLSKDLQEMPYPGGRPQGLAPGGWETATHTDLPGWQHAYRAKAGFPRSAQPQTPGSDVLLALTRYSPLLDELAHAAAERPQTRFPVAWDTDNPYMTALPHYNLEQHLVQTLRLRASAHLANGEAEPALRDLELCWRLCGDMRRDPILIAHLVQITCLGLSMPPVWEGLADRRWSAAELARLQTDLQRFDLLTDHMAAFRGERVYDLRGIDFMRDHGDLATFMAIMQNFGDTPKTNFLGRLGYDAVPRGWFDLNKTELARSMQNVLIETVDPTAHRFFLDKIQAGVRARNEWSSSYILILARLTLPVFDDISRKDARLQTSLDEAVTACALERFFLDHQVYPTRLDELVPAYLPHVPSDVINGAPLRYHATPDGRYQLYGVGWNARDDGGTIVRESSGRLKDTEGDWVWQYADLPPPGK